MDIWSWRLAKRYYQRKKMLKSGINLLKIHRTGSYTNAQPTTLHYQLDSHFALNLFRQ